MTHAAITSLVGDPLSAVAFVQDYVELHFDGPIVRALSNPLVAIGAKTYRFPGGGSRDALCSLIGHPLSQVTVRDGRALELAFEKGEIVTIPLGEADRRGPEAAHFVPGINQPIQVW